MSRIGIFTRRDFSLPTEPCVFCAKATRSQIQAHSMAPPAPCCVWCSFEAPADGRMQDFATLIEVEHFDVGFPNGVSCEPTPRLASVFGAEWSQLSPEQAAQIAADYFDARREAGCTMQEYRRRIGAGNLTSYARVHAASLRRERGER